MVEATTLRERYENIVKGFEGRTICLRGGNPFTDGAMLGSWLMHEFSGMFVETRYKSKAECLDSISPYYACFFLYGQKFDQDMMEQVQEQAERSNTTVFILDENSVDRPVLETHIVYLTTDGLVTVHVYDGGEPSDVGVHFYDIVAPDAYWRGSAAEAAEVALFDEYLESV